MTSLFTNLSNLKLKYICTLVVLLCLGVGNAWGAANSTTISGSSITGFGSGSNYTDGSYDAGDIGIASNGGFSTTQFRVGKSKTMTISTEYGKITKIEITCSSSSYHFNDATNLSYSGEVGTYTNAAGVTSVTFTNSNANIARITQIKVTYGYLVTYNKNDAGASGTMTDTNSPYAKNATVTVKSNSFTAPTNKTFSSWNIAAGGGSTSYAPSATFKITDHTTLYAQWVSSCSNSVALSKGSATNGTVNTISSASVATCSSTASDRRVTVTITPTACYDAPTNLTWTKTSGTVSVSKQSGPTDNGDGTYSYVYQFAQNDNGAGTFGVTCTAKAAGKTVNFNAGPGSCGTSSLTETCDGAGVTLPSVTATGVCKGWTTFAGWATAAVNDSSTTSVTVYAADSKFVPASNGQTLYAVYSKVKGSAATWDKVTSLSGITAGTYVIVSDGCALQNTEASSSPVRDATNYGVTISNNQITSSVSNAMKWTFTGDSYSAITIKSYADSDNYLYNGTNGNTGVRVGTTSDTWTFEVNTSAPAFAMYDATKSRYCCSTISTYNDWRSYTSADADNYRDDGKIYLFKQTGGSTTYYCSDPNCCTPLGSINGSFF